MNFTLKSLSTLCIDVQGGGESLNQLNERCVSYLNKISQEHTGNLQVSFLIFLLFPKSLWVTTLHQSLKEAKQIRAFYVTLFVACKYLLMAILNFETFNLATKYFIYFISRSKCPNITYLHLYIRR